MVVLIILSRTYLRIAMFMSSVKTALLFNVMGLKIKYENKGAKPSTTVTAPSETTFNQRKQFNE